MLRFGTVGTGWITDEYIHGAQDSGLWKLAAVYSRTPERGKEYAARHGAPLVFSDLEKMACSPELDAVYIASPNVLHYEHCRLFLEHGKHVICEKPLCAQAKKVRELQAIAQKRKLIFLEAIMFQHLPQRKLLEEALQQIGKITFVKLDFCQRSSKLDSYLAGDLPNIFNPAMETGAFMDLGVYCVYPALALFGLPESFHAEPLMLKSGADGGGSVTLRYSDKLVILTYSKLGQAGANTDFQGTEGTVAVKSISRLANISLALRGRPAELLHGEDEKYKLMGWEAKDFYRYITEPEASREEYERCSALSLQVSQLMEDVRKQGKITFPSDT